MIYLQAENKKHITMEDNKQNLMKYMANPKSFTLKRWFFELLKENYKPHDTIIERVSTSLTTEKDVEDFGALIMQVYHAAYLRAVNDYKEQAEKVGLKVVLSTKESN